jgi:hypothetical protein
MPRVAPWHSSRPGETVHHDNTLCTEGNNPRCSQFQNGISDTSVQSGTKLFVHL